MGSVKRIFSARVRIGRSRSSKVIDFGTNRKRVCDFLYVAIVILVLSFTVSDILQVFCSCPHPYSTLILGCSRWIRLPIMGFHYTDTVGEALVVAHSQTKPLDTLKHTMN